MSILKEGQKVKDYKVVYMIKANAYCETYRIADENDTPYFLKLYRIKNTPQRLLDDHGEVKEIAYCKQLSHRNIVSFVDSGRLMVEEGVCHYMITVYFSGELLAEKIQREGKIAPDEARAIFAEILGALDYMHNMEPRMLLHNDITPHNIMLSEKTGGVPELIDMGHVSPPCSGNPSFDTADLDVEYCSNQTFVGMYEEKSDLFAAVAVFYTMLTGHAPWHVELTADMERHERIERVKKARKQPLDLSEPNLDEDLKRLLKRGLEAPYADRFDSARQALHALQSPGEADDEEDDKSKRRRGGFEHPTRDDMDDVHEQATTADVEVKRGGGNGFADIAGMQELKDMLRQRVIFILKDKERSERYRLTPPNGMLLYGPPGCGKSFFAEKFAEETGFNFILVKASDLGSIYVHGTQGKIADLFKKAEQNAPTVLCFDEFDAFVPNRSNEGANHQAGEVNEFLSQLNNCSKRGIFVIATSNRPDKIDPAVLRTGRIDKQVYVPLPDDEARREMFALHLKGRPCQQALDFDKMSKLSEGYVASDIAYVVNEAAMIAAFNNEDITQELMEKTISRIHSSVRKEVLKTYDEIREKMDGVEHRNALPPIGFR